MLDRVAPVCPNCNGSNTTLRYSAPRLNLSLGALRGLGSEETQLTEGRQQDRSSCGIKMDSCQDVILERNEFVNMDVGVDIAYSTVRGQGNVFRNCTTGVRSRNSALDFSETTIE